MWQLFLQNLPNGYEKTDFKKGAIMRMTSRDAIWWGKYVLAIIDRWTSNHPGPAGFIVGVLLAASMFEW